MKKYSQPAVEILDSLTTVLSRLRQHIPGENGVKALTKYWTFEQSTIIILWKNFSP